MHLRIDKALMASIHIIDTDWDAQTSGLYAIIKGVASDLVVTPGLRQILLITKHHAVQQIVVLRAGMNRDAFMGTRNESVLPLLQACREHTGLCITPEA